MGYYDEELFRGILRGKSPVKRSSTAPKVVNIPIQFVESEPPSAPSHYRSRSRSRSPTASALKIQKVFRGFLVRRSTKRLIAINRGVDEIQRRISDGETLELIRTDKKEGLRVIETLMTLLFQLDSVHGVNSSVRDCRKSVANRAIALQEIVDAAVSAVDRTETQTLGERMDDSQQNAEAVAQALEIIGTDEQHSVGQIEESDGSNFESGSQWISDDENCEDDEAGEFVIVEAEADLGTRNKEGEHRVEKVTGESRDGVADESLQESLETSSVETLTDGGEVNEKAASLNNSVEETEEEGKDKRDDENKITPELLQKIMKDNLKMRKALISLTQRVQKLENSSGYVCRKLNKKSRFSG